MDKNTVKLSESNIIEREEQKTLNPDDRNMLLKEYESLVSQIIHWDSHFWTKSQFFLIIESAFVGVFLQTFKEQITGQSKPSPLLFYLFFFAAVFNIYLCYVWFRTNRRNREYLRLRLKRLRRIENDLGGVLHTFTDDLKKLPKGHGSAGCETHLATGFIIAWFILLIAAVILTDANNRNLLNTEQNSFNEVKRTIIQKVHK